MLRIFYLRLLRQGYSIFEALMQARPANWGKLFGDFVKTLDSLIRWKSKAIDSTPCPCPHPKRRLTRVEKDRILLYLLHRRPDRVKYLLSSMEPPGADHAKCNCPTCRHQRAQNTETSKIPTEPPQNGQAKPEDSGPESP